MKNILLLFILFIPAFLFAQYPATGNKQRLGYQTTGDGLIWRGVAADTAIKPRTTANAYFQLDTVNRVLRRYIATQGSWQVVGGSSTNVDSLIYATRYWVNSNFFPLEGGTLTGTGGAGFIGFPSQVSAPGTPASGLNVYAQGSSFNWKGTDGYERQFTSTLTGGRTYTLKDASGTLAFTSDIPLLPTTITAGQVAYSNGTNLVGSANHFWGNTNVRLGIGTNVPTFPLDVVGNTNGEYYARVYNPNSGGSVGAGYTFATESGTNNQGTIGKSGASYTTYKTIVAKDLFIYNGVTAGDISILNDFSTGKIKFSAGASTSAQMTLAATGNLLLGTTTDVATSILTARSTTKSSSPFPIHSTAEANAITGVENNWDWETGQGLRWHNGTRKAYALESTFARGTATRIPFFDANGQVTDNTSFTYNSATGVLNLANLVITSSNFTSVLIGRGVTGGSNSGVAIGYNATISNAGASPSPIAIGASATTGTQADAIAIGLSANASAGGVAFGRGAVSSIGVFTLGGPSIGGSELQIDVLQFGTTPTTGTYAVRPRRLGVSSAFGTNQTGSNLTLSSGLGTGTGTTSDLIFSTPTTVASGTTVQTLSERARIMGNTGFLGIGTSSPLRSVHTIGDIIVGDSTRLTTTPAHSAITGLLTRDANGWVGLASLAGGLSYSGGVLTGANIYTADGTIPSGGARTINMQHSSKVYFQNDTNDKAFWTELYDVSGRSFQGTETFNRHNGASGELGMKHYAQTYTGLNRYTYFF